MRLWHEALIPYLSNKRLSGQHRECCALRGNGWGRKHKTVDYVFTHSLNRLYEYHIIVIQEMKRRGFNVDERWLDKLYRGQYCDKCRSRVMLYHNADGSLDEIPIIRKYVYHEHDEEYLKECIDILRKKGDKETLLNLYGRKEFLNENRN